MCPLFLSGHITSLTEEMYARDQFSTYAHTLLFRLGLLESDWQLGSSSETWLPFLDQGRIPLTREDRPHPTGPASAEGNAPGQADGSPLSSGTLSVHTTRAL